MKTVLITGGAGFLGSHLCDYFMNKDYNVICMDNLVTGREENISHLMKKNRFRFLNHDVSKRIDSDNLNGDIDYILHFASPASPVDFDKMPVEIAMTNSVGTLNMLDLARKKNAVMMFASTSECYGDPEVNPQPETYNGNVNTTGIRSCYDESKRFAESLIMAYHRAYGVDVRIARIFNTYGPRMRRMDGRAVPAFINQALHDEPITVFGEGKQTRSFCFVDDEIEGFYRLLMSDEKYPVNIGNPHEISILDFAKKIIDVTSSSSEIVFKPLPEHDPKVRRPDITKAKEKLDWEPKIGIDEGLKRTIEYFKGVNGIK
ncbi:NAD-dependent epimerase/dehydratase family protein [Candidatus Woesearchaeota archaeon]|nr:NAD-dependent epimerase/dehydratase family protein [Candidatus Woesearchaeota archaeon]